MLIRNPLSFGKRFKGPQEKPSPESAGRLLALEGHRQYKQRVRDKCDEMRAKMGLPPVDWNAW